MKNMTPEESKMFAEFVRSEMATMSTSINNGGPAFPCETYGHRNGKETTIPTNGMSLRAYIAAKAMPAIIGLMTPADAAEYKPADLQAATARAACGYADALIAELEKEGK
jgi:hypothetical protein